MKPETDHMPQHLIVLVRAGDKGEDFVEEGAVEGVAEFVAFDGEPGNERMAVVVVLIGSVGGDAHEAFKGIYDGLVSQLFIFKGEGDAFAKLFHFDGMLLRNRHKVTRMNHQRHPRTALLQA